MVLNILWLLAFVAGISGSGIIAYAGYRIVVNNTSRLTFGEVIGGTTGLGFAVLGFAVLCMVTANMLEGLRNN